MAVTLAWAVAPAGPAAAAAAVPAPVAAYTFDSDDLATGVIADSSGNGLDATLVNGSTAALVDGALQLPGGASTSNGAYVTLPKGILEGRTDLTVSIRVKWDGVAAPWQWIYALGKDTTSRIFTTPYSGDGRLLTAVAANVGGAAAEVYGYAALPANVFKTITFTLDTSAGRLTTYLDGAEVSSAATTVTAGGLIDATTTSSGFIGKSFYADPLFDGAIDDFRVWGSALTSEQVASGLTPPTVTGLSETAFSVGTTIGTAPQLPAAVRGTFSDGYDRDVPIAWAAVDPSAYAQRGTFTVAGVAAGRSVTATVTVIREGEMTIDLGQSTGKFHGGASGSLYGLYGDGVPTNNLIEGMNLRTVSTKAQDGPQHPGADALEVVKPLADSTGGDVYIYMTDIHRGFPYQWPGSTPAEKLATYEQKIATQVDQVLTLDKKYQDHIVFVPFNEPEGNMFGTGEWSYDGTSWLTDPADYFAAWDEVYRLIKGKMPAARIAGPNTSILYDQVKGFLTHTLAAGTLPDVITWHELSHPEAVRESVAEYRQWEAALLPGKHLPININEYAFNYHTSVPGQMIQWISAIEESKVDADIAYWNIDGNISDSAVQANRGNGQWWLFNAYGSMTGDTVAVTPPYPGQNYTLQGVATLDQTKRQARAIIGGATSKGYIQFTHVPAAFGKRVHASIREIPWTGQIGDSAQPRVIAEKELSVAGGTVAVEMPQLTESSAYEIVLSPWSSGSSVSRWQGSYEAEAATWTGSGYSKNGPEGSTADVSKFYTSGGYDVGGLRTGSDGVLSFDVDVPVTGRYDLSVFANSLNTYELVKEQGPTNVFLRVDGAAEQELFLPLGYKWVVWDHTDTTVQLTAGKHTIALAAKSLDGVRATKGDAILDRITLSQPGPAVATYDAALASLVKAAPISGHVAVAPGGSATFWVYSKADAEATLDLGIAAGAAAMTVNGVQVGTLRRGRSKVGVPLSGGVNKVTVSGAALIDKLDVTPGGNRLPSTTVEAENGVLAGTATVAAKSLASGGRAVTGITGANTLTVSVPAARAGTYALKIRYSNPEQAEATHYNPDPLARHADIAINGGAARRVLFPHSFHDNNFWELTVPVQLVKGSNTIRFSSAELPNFDGQTYASNIWPDVLLRSAYAPLIDRVTVTPYRK
ncbi:LamG-like jellyroll fold domain-containing protein [Actinoplanes sp. NPDC026619]|uniref:LamG-like jellyroll fold domain-containing protein n=1 Tax=Actinoplanes sp. NPDC026619 TaxID=3155798 RepID=UPI0033EA7619